MKLEDKKPNYLEKVEKAKYVQTERINNGLISGNKLQTLRQAERQINRTGKMRTSASLGGSNIDIDYYKLSNNSIS